MVEKIKTFLFSLNKPAALFLVFSQAAGDFAGHSMFFFLNVTQFDFTRRVQKFRPNKGENREMYTTL